MAPTVSCEPVLAPTAGSETAARAVDTTAEPAGQHGPPPRGEIPDYADEEGVDLNRSGVTGRA